MAFGGLRLSGAILAVCLLAAGARAEDPDVANLKPTGVYLPATPNDYSGMIYSLLQEQTNRIMNKDGATDEGNPLSLLASMAGWAQQAQTALFTMGAPVNADGSAVSGSSLKSSGTQSFQSFQTPPIPDPTATLLNQNPSYGNTIGNSHPDPVPNNLVNLLIENPVGPQLDAAFKALGKVNDPIGTLNTTAFFGNPFTRQPFAPGVPPYFLGGGANVPLSQAGTVLSYRPCLFNQAATGISVNTQLIVVNPRIYTSTFAGIAVTPKLIEVQPALIKIKPVGLNVSPTGIQVYPRFINIGPQVSVSYPATPPPAKKAAAKAAAKTATASPALTSGK